MAYPLNALIGLKVSQFITFVRRACGTLAAALLMSTMMIAPAVAAEELAVASAAEAITTCRLGKSNAETSACYERVLNQFKEKVRRAQNLRVEELSGLSAKSYGGYPNVLRFYRAARDANRQWEAVTATECGPLIEAKYYGGQGEVRFAQLCQINLLAARLDAATAARR